MHRVVLSIFLLGISLNLNAQKMEEKQELKKVVNEFAQAVQNRNLNVLENLLNPNFRVLMQDGKSDEIITFTKEMYLNLMREQRIGGDRTIVDFRRVCPAGNTAMVEVDFSSEKMMMHMFLNLLKDSNGQWTIVSDIPFVESQNP